MIYWCKWSFSTRPFVRFLLQKSSSFGVSQLLTSFPLPPWTTVSLRKSEEIHYNRYYLLKFSIFAVTNNCRWKRVFSKNETKPREKPFSEAVCGQKIGIRSNLATFGKKNQLSSGSEEASRSSSWHEVEFWENFFLIFLMTVLAYFNSPFVHKNASKLLTKPHQGIARWARKGKTYR